MTEMDDRQKAFENKYAHDQEMQFKVEARACKLFGLWLAGELGMDGADAQSYAGTVVSANLDEPGFNDVIRAVRPDLDDKGLTITDEELLAKIDEFLIQAKQQFMEM